MKRDVLKRIYIDAVIKEASPDEFMRMVMAELKKSKRDNKWPVRSIDKLICRYIGIPVSNLYENKRQRDSHVFPRQLCMYFRHKYTKESLRAIGERYGNRDHATVIHSIKTVKNLIDVDKNVAKIVDELDKRINEMVHEIDKMIVPDMTSYSNSYKV